MRSEPNPQILIVDLADVPSVFEETLRTHGFELPITATSESDDAFAMLQPGGQLHRHRQLALVVVPGQEIAKAVAFISSLRQDPNLKRMLIFVLIDTIEPEQLTSIHNLNVAGCLETQIVRDEPEAFCEFLTRYLKIVKYPRRG